MRTVFGITGFKKVQNSLVKSASAMALAALAACAQQPTRALHTPAAGSAVNHWNGYIQEASNRFTVPSSWIRAVMQQESGGHQYIRGKKVRSVHGAVGLMQIKPGTYYELAQRYSLGSDPYDPHDNIMAGSGYIRELYDRFGSPDFLAAYNCGPQCAENHRSKGTALPGYAKAYMAAISPHLNDPAPGMMQPTQIAYAPAPTPPVTVVADTVVPPDNADIAPAPQTPTGSHSAPPLTDDTLNPPPPYAGVSNTIAVAGAQPVPAQTVQPHQAATAYAAATAPPVWHPTTTGQGMIQIGAFSTQERAAHAATVARRATSSLANAASRIEQVPSAQTGHTIWRTRLAGLPPQQTGSICTALRQQGLSCVPVTNP